MNTKLRAISLFAGCGGMDFGAEKAGIDIIWANEIEHDAAETLRQNFKNAEIAEGDIKKIKSFPEVDIVIGGYPCQSFSMGGNRNPENDKRTYLYLEFLRCLNNTSPKFFVAENVSGLKKIDNGSFLHEQIRVFNDAGKFGYDVYFKVVDAKDYGVPQSRKRLFIVGIRKDLKLQFSFPEPSHGKVGSGLLAYESHGHAIKGLPSWPEGEFYERPHDPEGHMSWYYMSRNRRAPWVGPSFTIVANWRHVTLHPASPVMKLTWSNLSDGWKQRWDFTDEHDAALAQHQIIPLDTPRRLSWRECARIQTFPANFEPFGKVESKFTQIGNAVPPLLAEKILKHLVSGRGLQEQKVPPQQLALI
ncbi:DNA cytosine methyltransferase [Desulfovibrio desulfuricans]|uniref:Cytosine-specific methyltransferase n=1 Tax=Desulfovibrio desulfuricans TaxID=876 RepID=A0A4P7UPC5_DESDE|nr:DNA cytosine methyltransferase [Desulfovibrio desulfuricans]QCC86794.1 DNA cytosine methyltransferase [Desulfovibrio desulfuricans]